ncbi:MAG: T9SS C-terminal target domain-containing protein [Flavobacteriales bacterium]|nr:T9SS C-terminal target domain-containing protein [Flavobacteriales bacterium]MCB9165906.1 T9SS C-terminal target domain-containing protein [Flavobacteriales bacterium]
MKGPDRMQLTRTFAFLLILALGTSVASARESIEPRKGEGQGGANGQPKAAGCAPATVFTELDLNNVRTRVETGGNMWQDRTGSGGPAYEVPKTADRSGADALFAGALWMGGFSPDNQLKLAAVRFRQVGNDFWPGPLTNTGDASIDPDVCLQYDRTWKTLRQDAEVHQGYYQCALDPNCDVNEDFPDFNTPTVFYEWPAHGDINLDQDYYLAPYVDFDGSGDYDPDQGDYPGFDLDGVVDCKNRFREDPVPLFGDQNIWWVFNDKGNAHTESGGLPIGMEVRAQAFAFSTNDEVNNMTFYNYVLINQGTQTLQNTYFGQWVDCDLGCADDDYVGCDVQRGLGYAYNGDNNDENCNGHPGYGVQPPAVGVDFFEGPFQDYDGLDNPLTTDFAQAIAQKGIPYAGIGIGYGDTVPDNERFGMRAFLYHNNSGGVTGDPSNAIHYYNYLRAIWKDNSPCLYGGTGHISDPEADPNTPSFYMFPGDSDPLGWGTGGAVQGDIWSEETAGNPPGDRRFIQSAGPFTLEPGSYNNITVGVVWARATGGGPFESVELVRQADDKAQALFDNCFQILNGPDAPDLTIVELDQELILHISNSKNSNNYNESYVEVDPTIPPDAPDRNYRFQGYQVYQVKDGNVNVADLRDINQARLVFQCDIKDGVAQIVNFIQDNNINLPVPTEMVDGSDDGISHSVKITEDKFAQGDPHLINFKTYYYIAIAYGYNNWEDYNSQTLTGQPYPYVAGRKAAAGAIRSYSGIPHKPAPQDGGTVLSAQYGDEFALTRWEGQGNGGNALQLDQTTLDAIVSGAPWRHDKLTYISGSGPVAVKVIDPLNVRAGDFELWVKDSATVNNLNDAYWELVSLNYDLDGDGMLPDTITSDRTIEVPNEQLFISPDLGISINVAQAYYTNNQKFTEFLGAEVSYADPEKAWLSGIPDGEGNDALNWIRAGISQEDGNSYNDYLGKDDDETYEQVLPMTVTTPFGTVSGGTWAPWPLVGDTAFQPAAADVTNTLNITDISDISSCVVVFTSDKSKWTRCPVLEEEENPGLAVGGAKKLYMRESPSVDKNGRRSGTPGCNEDEATMSGQQPNGMGWFPGYAVNLETGERLNMAFGEASFWGGSGGRDMIWNPSDSLATGQGQPIFGGCHYIYVFGNRQVGDNNNTFMPQYDEANYLYTRLSSGSGSDRTRVFRAVDWVGAPLRAAGASFLSVQDGLIPTETHVVLDVAKPYKAYKEPFAGYSPSIPTPPYAFRNNGDPLYTFNTGERAVIINDLPTAETACDMINIVPNPYYGFSSYETSRLDNRVKFINLPQTCTISIYNVSGTLVRRFKKDNDLTYLDWDLRNQANVPIAGGVYICHIDVPGVCERVVKWFGAMRPVDLQNF